MLDNIRGVISFKVHGAKLYSFVDEVRRRKLGCRAQKMQEDWLYAQCYRRYFDEIESIASEFGLEIEQTGRKGAVFTAYKYRLRLGIFFGLVLAFGIIVYFSNIVTEIEVNGCESVGSDTVMTALENCGIERGAFIPSLNFESCERRVMLAVKDIAWIGIRNTGGRIVVDIDEMHHAPEMLDENTPCNIVAAYDAQIVELSVLEGVACVEKGYTVKKGDVIISGVQIGEKESLTVKHALGEVKGIYSRSVTFSQSLNQEERTETGKIKKRSAVDLLSLEIPLFFGKCEYDDFILAYDIKELYFFGKKLPISIENYEYRECITEMRGYDENTAQSMLYEQKSRYEKNFLENTEIMAEKCEISCDGETVYLTVNYTLMGEIGEKNEILFKNSD